MQGFKTTNYLSSLCIFNKQRELLLYPPYGLCNVHALMVHLIKHLSVSMRELLISRKNLGFWCDSEYISYALLPYFLEKGHV